MLEQLQLEYWPIDRLTGYIRNPRKNDQVVDKIVASLKEFGFAVPVLAKKDGSVIDGHLRLKGAKKIGLTQVPVVICDGWTDAQVKSFRLLANRSVQWAEWDNDLLALELKELKDLEFDLSLTGFDELELSSILAPTGTEGLTDEDETPEAPAEPVSKLGDLWILGDHRLMCGDSTKSEDVSRLLNGAEPFIMVTDPPYGINYDPDWRSSLDSIKRSTGKVKNDDQVDWSPAYLLFPGDVAYVWHAGTFAGDVAVSLLASNFKIRGQIIWSKPHFVISRGAYHPQHEPCWYAVRSGKTANWRGDRTQSTIWSVNNGTFQGGKASPEDTKTGHGTQKPVEIMRRPIVNHTASGDSVYEPFCGSGSTLIACEKEGRKCFAMELDPKYVDVICQRFQDFTGREAIREDGVKFNDLKPAVAAAAA